MKIIHFFPIAGIVGICIFSACNSSPENEEETLSANVVNNPNTASGKVDKNSLPIMQFEEKEHNFGKILQGETVSINFKFTNEGNSDLIIAEVSTSCGCTVPSYPKTPIKPGEKGVIKVAFSSKGQKGFQSKNILVVANTQPNTTVLRIKAQVMNVGEN